MVQIEDDGGGGCAENGWPDDDDDDGGGGGSGQPAPPPATDEDGYRVEHRFETESVSRCKEVRDVGGDESGGTCELRMRETKEVTLEELKTRDGEARPATADELRALMEAQWDGVDEVEISREVVVEQFDRVESEREEVRSVVVLPPSERSRSGRRFMLRITRRL